MSDPYELDPNLPKWENRIVGLEMVDPSQLIPHPKNPKIHPKAQQGAVVGSLNSVGWFQPIVVSANTHTVLDGHARINLAMRKGEEVPVVYVDVTETEEAQIVATLDRFPEMAIIDPELFGSLLEDFNVDDEHLQQMIVDMQKEVALPSVGDWADLFSSLPEGEREPFRQATFTLHDTQFEQVQEALNLSKGMGAFDDSPNQNSNGNALTRICKVFITQNGKS